jgi:hypothetical protein
LGFDKEKMREVSEENAYSSASISFFIGLGLGILSFFVPPATILIAAFAIAMGYAVLKTPEIGVVLIILALPFFNNVVLCISIAYVFLCYVIKCIIGKRTFKFEYFDVWVVVLGVVILLRGLISSNFAATATEALITCCVILSYFIITNLIKTKEWFKRCGTALLITGTLVSVIAIIQAIIGEISVYVPDLSRIFTQGQSATSVFADPEVLAHFLVALLPFIFVKMISSKKGAEKFGGFVIFLVTFIAIILTHSFSAIMGAAAAILLLLVFYSRNYSYLYLILLVAIPILILTLPEDAKEKILSLKTFEDISFSAKIEEVRHGFDLFAKNPFGIGTGEIVFMQEFNTTQTHVESLPLQFLIEQGIVGMVAICSFVVMFARLTLTYADKSKNKYRKINGCAGFCAIIGLMCAGLISYTLYDERLLLVVWVLVALTDSYMRIEREDEEPSYGAFNYMSGSLDIILTGENERDNVPKRKYVRIPKQKIKETEQQSEAKEFDELELPPSSQVEIPVEEVTVKKDVGAEFE